MTQQNRQRVTEAKNNGELVNLANQWKAKAVLHHGTKGGGILQIDETAQKYGDKFSVAFGTDEELFSYLDRKNFHPIWS